MARVLILWEKGVIGARVISGYLRCGVAPLKAWFVPLGLMVKGLWPLGIEALPSNLDVTWWHSQALGVQKEA
jgi:hypothetical protein